MKLLFFLFLFLVIGSQLSHAEKDGDPWCWKDARTHSKSNIPVAVTEKLSEQVTQKVGQVLGSVRLSPINLPPSTPADKIEEILNAMVRWVNGMHAKFETALNQEIGKVIREVIVSINDEPAVVDFSGSFEYRKKAPNRGKWENLRCASIGFESGGGFGGATVEFDGGIALGVALEATVGFGGSAAGKITYQIATSAPSTRPPRNTPTLEVFCDTFWVVESSYSVMVTVGVEIDAGVTLSERMRGEINTTVLNAGVEKLILPETNIIFLNETCR